MRVHRPTTALLRNSWRLLTINNSLSERVAWLVVASVVVSEFTVSAQFTWSSSLGNRYLVNLATLGATRLERLNTITGLAIFVIVLVVAQWITAKVWRERLRVFAQNLYLMNLVMKRESSHDSEKRAEGCGASARAVDHENTESRLNRAGVLNSLIITGAEFKPHRRHRAYMKVRAFYLCTHI